LAQRGIRAEALAAACGVAPSTARCWLAGIRRPSGRHRGQIEKSFGERSYHWDEIVEVAA